MYYSKNERFEMKDRGKTVIRVVRMNYQSKFFPRFCCLKNMNTRFKKRFSKVPIFENFFVYLMFFFQIYYGNIIFCVLLS